MAVVLGVLALSAASWGMTWLWASQSLEPVSSAKSEIPLDDRVSVNVNAEPWAKIWIDDREVGETPQGEILLVPGWHRFRAKFEDGREVSLMIEIDADRRWVVFE